MLLQNVPDRLDPSDKESIFYMEYMEDQQKELTKICNKISVFKTILKLIFE
tara:strand:+ start:390 stop:542 length:153 start_codon:yes stop_codon:yes gene_type:complete